MLDVQGISKRFGSLSALHEVTFQVGRGEVVGFLGPNGAGKSTTLRIITGYLHPDAGRVLLDGRDVSTDPRGARRRMGYMPESVPLHGEMRVEEYLRFRARLKEVAKSEIDERIRWALDCVKLGETRRRLLGRLSRGTRQRVGIADALLARPPLLLLDEPHAGLDPLQLRELRSLVGDLSREHTLLLSSHVLPEIEAVAARVVMVAGGRVVLDEPLEAIRARGSLEAEFARVCSSS
jgi:ABC-2 type transport system ATP-binding protein